MMKYIFAFILLPFALTAFSQRAKNKIICALPVAASFPGGNDALRKLIAKEFKLPGTLPDTLLLLKGKIKFTIQKNGTPAKFVILEKVGYTCDEEVIRIISSTKWNPARFNGKLMEDIRVFPYSITIDPAEN